jgi:hypothetical protein
MPYIKINTLSWAGHIVRMENSRTVSKVFDTRAEGTRRTGSPKLRWEDGVGVRNCRNVVMNRENWLKPLKKARADTGLPSG